MKKIFGLEGKKYLAVLLEYQLLFLVCIQIGLFVWGFDLTKYIPLILKILFFFTSYASLVLLVGGLWQGLQDQIFRLNYVRAQLLYKNFLRPLLLLLTVFATLVSVQSNYMVLYIFLSVIGISIFINCIILIKVQKDIRKDNKLISKYHELLDYAVERFGSVATKRLANTIHLMNDTVSGNSTPGHRGFSFVGLTSKPWHRVEDYNWVRILEDNYENIRNEAQNLWNNKNVIKSYNYPGMVKGNWDSVMLINHGVQKKICEQCPVTLNLLKQLPGNLHFREAMFSILRPHSAIIPHRDYGNTYLTYHLGLDIPSDCKIIVGGEERIWNVGKSLIFDTSYEHEAKNDSDKSRLILLIDFMHPDLNEAEIEFIKNI